MILRSGNSTDGRLSAATAASWYFALRGPTVKNENDGASMRARKKAMPRRTALSTALRAGGGVIALAAVGGGVRLWQSGAGGNLAGGPGFDPWRAWEAGTVKGQEGIVAAAILAASPHNSQPWKFKISENNVDLFADTSRTLGTLDPVGREILLGLGCAVENMVVGAQALGFTPILNMFPAGASGDHIARLTVFTGERTKPPEAAALAQRHTHRGAYARQQGLSRAMVDDLNAQVKRSSSRLVWLGADSTAGKHFVDATLEATIAIVEDPDIHRDSAAWFRHDLAQVNNSRDGISTSTAGMSGLMTRLALTVPGSMIGDRQHRQWIEMTRDVQLPTAPMFGLITVPDLADRPALIEAGRIWQRLHLTGTLKGLAMQPLNQMMELADRDRALGRPSPAAKALEELGGFADSVVAFGFRVGRASGPAPASPRRTVEQVLAS